jgi:hypothetical protein
MFRKFFSSVFNRNQQETDHGLNLQKCVYLLLPILTCCLRTFSQGIPCVPCRIKSGICRTYVGVKYKEAGIWYGFAMKMPYLSQKYRRFSPARKRCFNYHYKTYLLVT